MDENRSLYNVLLTTRKMLQKRGYEVPELDWTTSFPKFKAHVMSKAVLRAAVAVADDDDNDAAAPSSGMDTNKLLLLEYGARRIADGELIRVQFAPDKKLASGELMRQHARLVDAKPKVTRAILITGSNPGGVIKTAILSLRPGAHIEVFSYTELLVDITEHEYVPHHTLLTEDEKQALLSRYHVTENQLPRMVLDDPISRFYGLHLGQVMKIVRKSTAAGRSVTYRVVV